MLNSMRGGAGSLVAKIMLGLLILSFSVWGIEDMLRNRGRGAAPITIAGEDISRATFERAYRQEMDRMKQMLGKDYTPELVRMFNIEHKVANDLVTNALVSREASSLGLLPPDEMVAKEIRGMPSFKNDKGQFDKTLFQAVLRRNNMSEAAFAAEIRREMATRLLLETVASPLAVHDGMTQLFVEAAREECTAQIATLSPSLVKDVKDPTDPQVEEYYKQHTDMFVLPELRTFSVLFIPSEVVQKSVTVSEEEVKAAYQERATLFGDKAEPLEKARESLIAELKREKLSEAMPALSTKLEDLLAGGATLKEAAKEVGGTVTTLPPMTQQGKTIDNKDVPNLPAYPSFLMAAFSVVEGTESPLTPSTKNDGFYLIHTDSVQPAMPKPLSAVRGEVAAAWKKEETQSRLQTLAAKIAAEAKKSADPAAALAKSGAALAASGPLKRGNEDLPAALTEELFTLSTGQSTDAYPVRNGAYAVAILTGRRAPSKVTVDALKKDKELSVMADQLSRTRQNQLLEEYLTYLRGKYDVKINENVLAAYAGEGS